jgi:hypothetical protein
MTPRNEDSSRLRCGNTNIRRGAFIILVIATMIMVNTTTAISAPPDAGVYIFLERFHGHTCAGSLMGLRLGVAAKEACWRVRPNQPVGIVAQCRQIGPKIELRTAFSASK